MNDAGLQWEPGYPLILLIMSDTDTSAPTPKASIRLSPTCVSSSARLPKLRRHKCKCVAAQRLLKDEQLLKEPQ